MAQLPIPAASHPGDTPFDPKKPAVPVSFPLKTLDDLESRSYFSSFHYPFNVSSVPLAPELGPTSPRPRMLVVHDMKGGYLDDKWVQGGSNPGAYSIWHWYLMDVFCYFSHNLVTLPPPCWTNAAHTHGVKVLGTFITEGGEGRVVANKLLATKESAQMYAERLTELAVALKFDGWLINMEVELDSGQIPTLKEFVDHLTKSMHSAVVGSLVIWYDSITKDGFLSYQNELNENNKPFFDICDGILTNYAWEETSAQLSATNAGDRRFDVYMGIDVFGRGSWKGGWEINIPLDVLKRVNISSGIFAPGWVYENNPPDFESAQNRWWALVENSFGILKFYPKQLPFFSNFDQGYGNQFSIEGFEVSKAPWDNISCQFFQPMFEKQPKSVEDPVQVSIDSKGEPYSGGASILFSGNLDSASHFSVRLFQGHLPLSNTPMHISFSIMSDGNSLLGLSLSFSAETNGKQANILLAAAGNLFPTGKFAKIIIPNEKVLMTETECEVDEGWICVPSFNKGWILNEASISMKNYVLTAIHIVCYLKEKQVVKSGKETTTKKVGGRGAAVTGISPFQASLGHISIRATELGPEFPPATAWAIEGQDVAWATNSSGMKTVSLKINWKLKAEYTNSFLAYYVYSKESTGSAKLDPVYIGVARGLLFYVSDLEVPSATTSLRFIIQPCVLAGLCQKLEDCPAFQLAVSS